MQARGAVVTPDGNVSFNFVNADVREVAREILGEQLHLSYVVDPKIQTTVTAQTGSPIPKSAVLPTMEGVLRASGLALVESEGLYRILPLEDAARSSSPTVVLGATRSGYAIRVLPLKFIPAAELKTVLDPFVPPGGVLQADGARNLLIVSGPASDLGGFTELVRQFDTDWMRGTSFALYPLQVGLVKDVGNELQMILQEGQDGTGPLTGVVRIVPIERLNAILVIATDPSYLPRIKTWIDRLDYGDDQTTPRLFEYFVQNSRAIDLAGVLTDLLSSGEFRGPSALTAPGSPLTEVTSPLRGGRQGAATGIGLGAAPTSQVSPLTAAPSPMTGGVGALGAAPTGAPLPGTQGQAQGQGLGQALRPGLARPAETAAQRAGLTSLAGTATGLELPPIRIVADEKNNALVIFARPRDYKMIEGIIRKLDIVPLQVLIEATIAEVTLTDSLRYGVQFFLQQGGSRASLTTASTGSVSASDITGVFPGFNYVLSGSDSRAILSLLSSVSNVNVISSPQLLVLDHQTAALQVGDQVPIVVQSAQSVINPDSPIVNSVQYRNTGVVLQVTPRVNTSGLVTLDIDQEVSDVTKTTSSTINSPTIAQRRVISSIIVQDGETVALGGLIRDNQNDSKAGIPVLSDLPLIGPLFRDTSRATSRTELLVLLAPRVVRNPTEVRGVTEELRSRMRALRPLDVRVR